LVNSPEMRFFAEKKDNKNMEGLPRTPETDRMQFAIIAIETAS